MNKKWHKEVMEALGMMASKARIVNKLNAAAVKSDDPKLRIYAEKLITEIQTANSNTESRRPKDMLNSVPKAKKVISYCESIVFSE